jgi:hypothetical protein
MAAENQATKNIKNKLPCRLKRLENFIKNATINKKRAASTEGRWDLRCRANTKAAALMPLPR